MESKIFNTWSALIVVCDNRGKCIKLGLQRGIGGLLNILLGYLPNIHTNTIQVIAYD